MRDLKEDALQRSKRTCHVSDHLQKPPVEEGFVHRENTKSSFLPHKELEASRLFLNTDLTSLSAPDYQTSHIQTLLRKTKGLTQQDSTLLEGSLLPPAVKGIVKCNRLNLNAHVRRRCSLTSPGRRLRACVHKCGGTYVSWRAPAKVCSFRRVACRFCYFWLACYFPTAGAIRWISVIANVADVNIPVLISKKLGVVQNTEKMPSASCDTFLNDIEDIVSQEDSKPQDRHFSRKHVVPKVRRRNTQKYLQEENSPPSDSTIPGIQKIWIRTWGCSHNNSDGEYMAGQLAAYGYKITENASDADLWLLNSCTVKNPAEDHFRNSIKKAQEENKKIVLAGCVPQAQPRQDYLKGLSIIGVQQIDRVVEVVEETIKGHSVRLLGQKKDNGKRLGGARLDLPKIRKNPLIEIISINTGCLNACTYCKTKHARGNLASYPIDELVDRAKQSFQEGVCEIWLTSEDTGAYGRDIGSSLPALLWKLVEVIPEGAMLRLGMTNPPYILEHLEEMAKILHHPRVYAFLHIPVQSASDTVLMEMKREYCVADFKRVVDFLKDKVPGITIATDIICGFPGETDQDFQETVKLVEEYKFPSLFINQFYPRPGTPAAKMEQVPAQVKKQRTKELSRIFHSYNPYDHKIGQRQQVLVTEESFDSKFYVAHNRFYEQVLVPKNPTFMGKMVEVDIYESGKHFMKGQPVSDAKVYTPSISKPLARGEVSGLTEEFRNRLGNHLNSVPHTSAANRRESASSRMVLRLQRLHQDFALKMSVGLALFALLFALLVKEDPSSPGPSNLFKKKFYGRSPGRTASGPFSAGTEWFLKSSIRVAATVAFCIDTFVT
ncbi:hypothetical protein E5288_WYG019869 [Bos mutus]|uniref:Threonylcarbamoyladenosine tRNA methylthiotransferase n=1 Tax=Bos mutus TaxID=72004 RepID=A0A6B0RUS4_9CETA|nr:hypothetical protein [Bos mutus]